MKTIAKNYAKHLRRQAAMFALFIVLMIIIGVKSFGQGLAGKTEIIFKGTEDKESLTIKVGDRIDFFLRKPVKRFQATILSFADTSVVIVFNQPPYQLKLPVENISRLKVNENVFEKSKVKIVLSNNEVLKGSARFKDSEIEFTPTKNKRASQDQRLIPISSVNKILLKRKHCISIGFLTGTIAGAILGGATYHKQEPDPYKLNIVFDFGPGAAIAGGAILGASAGLVVGSIVGAIPKSTVINGDEQNYKNFRRHLVPTIKKE